MTPNKFDTMRGWNGEQSRAFEELSYQLLRAKVPTGARAVRTGNPDGGVEWYATLPDGIEHGWQAKHVHGIDNLLGAMTDSVKRVAKERPQLRHLTFVISSNLGTGTAGPRGKPRQSQRQKYEAKVKTWQSTIRGAEHITFDLVQESDLLAELAKPEHRGRAWFWWDQVVFDEAWLEKRFNEQASAASEKYRPDLQVDIPIQQELLGLGFDAAIVDQFEILRRDVRSAIDDLDPWPRSDNALIEESLEKVRTAAAQLRAQVARTELRVRDMDAVAAQRSA